jgi:DNA-binding response OmpR family regulator
MINDPVLLVEDNPDDEELTLRGCKQAGVHNRLDVAHDGQKAIDHLFGTADHAPEPLPAVVLLDLKLPRFDGLEILKRIRHTEHPHRVPVVILTSSREEHDLINEYDLGANSYVCKPVQLDQLAELALAQAR